MKYVAVALLLNLWAAGMVFSRSHHSLHNRDFDGSSNFDDNSQCMRDMETCVTFLKEKYPSVEENPINAFLQFRANGARAACSDYQTYRGCVQKKMAQPACQRGSQTAAVQSALDKYWRLGDGLCVNRIDDFSKHWNCILSFQVAQKMSSCEQFMNPFDCDDSRRNQIVDCVADQYSGIADCKAGSREFIKEFLPEILDIAQICPASGSQPGLMGSLERFLKV